jgi:hypothetical protein
MSATSTVFVLKSIVARKRTDRVHTLAMARCERGKKERERERKGSIYTLKCSVGRGVALTYRNRMATVDIFFGFRFLRLTFLPATSMPTRIALAETFECVTQQGRSADTSIETCDISLHIPKDTRNCGGWERLPPFQQVFIWQGRRSNWYSAP